MKCSTTGQEEGDLYIQVTAKKGDLLSRFDCRYFFFNISNNYKAKGNEKQKEQ